MEGAIMIIISLFIGLILGLLGIVVSVADKIFTALIGCSAVSIVSALSILCVEIILIKEAIL
jgi:hypothetical protein